MLGLLPPSRRHDDDDDDQEGEFKAERVDADDESGDGDEDVDGSEERIRTTRKRTHKDVLD